MLRKNIRVFFELYHRNFTEDQKPLDTYKFTDYLNENQDHVELPDVIKEKILKKQIEISQYPDPAVWAKQRFDFQKTPGFRNEIDSMKEAVMNRDINILQVMIESQKQFQQFHGNDDEVKVYSQGKLITDEMLLKDEADKLATAKAKQEKYHANRESILDREVASKTQTLEELESEAQENKKKLETELAELNETYKKTLAYIQAHSDKK